MIEIDPKLSTLPLSMRERVCIRLCLFLIGMIYPGKYDHQMVKFLDEIYLEMNK